MRRRSGPSPSKADGHKVAAAAMSGAARRAPPVHFEWYLDKRVSLAIIGAVMLNTFWAGYFAATQTARTDAVTQRVEALERARAADGPRQESVRDSVVRMEGKVDNLQSAVAHITASMEKLVSRR